MKKILAGLIAVSMIATPAMARHRNHDQDNRRYEHKENRRGGCGWLCGAIIGGLIVGTISSDRRNESENARDYDDRYYPPNYRYDTRYCVREQIVEYRYGQRYIYWQTTCN